MTQHIALPAWLVVAMAALSLFTILTRLVLPIARGLLRRRVNRVIEELNTRLSIRIQSLKLTKREVLIDRLLNDAEVLKAADTAAREEGVPREAVHKRLATYANEMVPAFNAYVYFRVGYWIARKAARFLYRVRLGYSDEAGLAAIPEDATVVFLMNHRSNMDYVLVSYLAAERTALSYAVGEWARIWPLQTLFRAMGAYFIRRDSKNPLYRKVLERYVAMATAGGVTQAVYPEGGLSRDGALRKPRLGILDYMLRSFDPSGERDLVFVPVGINYDRTLEDRTLLLDVKEAPKEARAEGASGAVWTTLSFVAKNLALMAKSEWHRFGYACVNFGTPISIKRFCRERSLDFRALGKEERFRRVEELATEVMVAIARVIPVLPVPVVATVFTTDPERVFTELEVKTRALELMDALEARGAHVYVPRKEKEYAIAVGLRMLTLRHLIETVEEGLFRAKPTELLVLRYYAASIAHLPKGPAGDAMREEPRAPISSPEPR